ncbi:MAG: sulfatase [Roseibacillus sp.]
MNRLALLLLLSGFWAQLPAAKRPNILFIFADDLGWKDVGYQGTDFYDTPNIDRLASEGMIFTDGYAAAGNCAPSRACLLSGQYTPRHGLFAVGSTKRGTVNMMRMEPVPNANGLASKVVTMAEALKAAGYATGCFGKWHLGSKGGGTGPGDQGFDVVMDKNSKGGKIQEDPKGIFTITKAACEFMEQNKDKPFFAYVPHHAIHTAHHGRAKTVETYTRKKKGEQHNSVMYSACTHDLDAGVGILLQKLDDLGLRDNTLVVFTSDNGATRSSPQEPLRGNKGSYHEGGIREPFIIRWPGVTKPGSKCNVPVINVDLYPTFLDATGSKVAEGKTLDGESLVPLLKGEPALRRKAIFWHFPGYLNTAVIRGRDPDFRTRPVSVIRKGDWKLYLYHEEWQLDGGAGKLDTNNAVELYNLAADIGEFKDVAASNKSRRDELLGDLRAWFKETRAPLPTEKNPSYDPNAKPAENPKGRTRKKNKKDNAA